MRNGSEVAAFEREFAAYVGAKYAIALCNGTATLHTALAALGVGLGDRVAVPPLTMSATTIAVLHAGATPVFHDVDERTWLMNERLYSGEKAWIFVDLFGLQGVKSGGRIITDAAQTLRKHSGQGFTSYSFQASKILALGEGGMLVTNDEELATRAREFSSLGYRMRADQPRIEPAALKSPTYERHHSLGWNYRMSDLVAREGLRKMQCVEGVTPDGREYSITADGACMLESYVHSRRCAAAMYREAIAGCDWLTPQHVPDGWCQDYWTYAVKIDATHFVADDFPLSAASMTDSEARRHMVLGQWHVLASLIEKHGGERPYACWLPVYKEPFWDHRYAGAFEQPSCPIAEDLQPRLMLLQTNDLASAERNAKALRKAIEEIG